MLIQALPVVPAIERLDDATLAADPEQLEDLVSLFDQRRHRHALSHAAAWFSQPFPCGRAGRRDVRGAELAIPAPSRANDGRQGARQRHLPRRGPDRQPSARHPRGFPAGWCVTDFGSSNGTRVNGERTRSSQRLRHGDEIRVGQSRLIFRDALSADGTQTEDEDAPPTLTTRERDVILALCCRPLLDRDMFTEPASTRAIADELVITQAAVKRHRANLDDKFGVPPPTPTDGPGCRSTRSAWCGLAQPAEGRREQ